MTNIEYMCMYTIHCIVYTYISSKDLFYELCVPRAVRNEDEEVQMRGNFFKDDAQSEML